MAGTSVSQHHGDGFDPRRWLADWTENGGMYVLAGDMLHLRRHRPIDQSAAANLDRLRDQMLRSGGGPAVADVLIRRRNGDVR
jgi:hypothetical protein